MTFDAAANPQEALQHLLDRQAILDCIVRECRGRDRHDADLVAGCYWDDATIEGGGGRIVSAADYPAGQNAGHAALFAATAHNITNHICEIDGDVAHSEAYCIGALLSKDRATCRFVASRYLDRFERRQGEWRIALRRNSIEMSADGDASWAQSGVLAGFLKGVWSREDPSYHRPFAHRAEDTRW